MNLWLQILCLFISCFCSSQQTEYVDFKSAKANISFDIEEQLVKGDVTYTFNILKDTDSVFLDAQNFKQIKVCSTGGMHHKYNKKRIVFERDFKKGEAYEVKIDFKTHPKKALYFINWGTSRNVTSSDSLQANSIEKRQVWTQGQGKYTSNWLPSIDDMNDKIEFDLSITFDKDYEVIANGKLTDKQLSDSTTTWHYDMQQPMASYLVALAIGKYHKKVAYSKSGIPIEMYFYPEDSLKFEPTYRYTKRMFDFLEEEIGVPYPWQNNKQVPVKDFLYAGMENTSLTIFSDRYVVDSIAFIDRSYVNVNAHELAHQWFGDLVTETSGTHHWLQEGFATYYALLAEKDIFGEDYYNWQLYDYAQELLGQDKNGQSTSLLDPKSSSTTFYKKGAWVLHLFRERVGDMAFKKAVKNYLLKHQFGNVETEDFISEVEKTSGQDLTDFVENHFNNIQFFNDELENWSKSFLKVQELTFETLNQTCPVGTSKPYWIECLTDSWKKCYENKTHQWRSFLVNHFLEDRKKTNDDFIKYILSTDDLKARQKIAQNGTEVSRDIKDDYEKLLNDDSYLTKEYALLNLWRNFPETRIKYLDEAKHLDGFNDKNIRTLWLTLALLTEDYKANSKSQFYDELLDYTDPKHHFEIRQNAFQYLYSINACNDVCKKNLEQASEHHVWQFRKLARQLLEKMKQ